MSHTPRPWVPVPREMGGFVIESGGVVVAIAPRRPRTAAEAKANADLIAAAPDMLAALIEAAEFVQPFNRAEALLDKIEAAIKLARQP